MNNEVQPESKVCGIATFLIAPTIKKKMFGEEKVWDIT